MNQRLVVTVCFTQHGIYRALLNYNGITLHNGEFDCIVLTGKDSTSKYKLDLTLLQHFLFYNSKRCGNRSKKCNIKES